MSLALGDSRTRKDFDLLGWLSYKRETEQRYREHIKGTRWEKGDKFYQLHDRKDLKHYFYKGKYRRILLLEKLCNYFRLTGRLPEHLIISLEDFIVHLHWFKDTFQKDPETILSDLQTIDDYLYRDILYSVLYKDIHLYYRYRVSPRLLRYLTDGTINILDRSRNKVTLRLNEYNRKYFTKGEAHIIEEANGEPIAIVRDRIRYYKDYMEGYKCITQ